MVFYYTVAGENVTVTAQHFSVSRKTFHKWVKRFKDSKYDVRSLADRSRAPHSKRHWEVTLVQEERIRYLRKKYPTMIRRSYRLSIRRNMLKRSPDGRSRRYSEDIDSIMIKGRQRRLPEREPELVRK